jgi:3-dehydroquinate synthase class II
MHRYNDMNFLMAFDFEEVMAMYIKARDENILDKLWKQYLVDYSGMTKETFVKFEDYKKQMFKIEVKKEKLDKETIIADAETIKAMDQKGGN